MLEKKEITKRLIKNMLINFVIFTAILIVFDFIIYNNIVRSLYREVDMQLENATQIDNRIERVDTRNKNIEKFQSDEALDEKVINPRLTIIERDNEGNILNEEKLGALSNYLSEIKFNKDNLNNIYNLQINSEYSYRAINYKSVKNGETVYSQVLVNVDGEARNTRKFI